MTIEKRHDAPELGSTVTEWYVTPYPKLDTEAGGRVIYGPYADHRAAAAAKPAGALWTVMGFDAIEIAAYTIEVRTAEDLEEARREMLEAIERLEGGAERFIIEEGERVPYGELRRIVITDTMTGSAVASTDFRGIAEAIADALNAGEAS